MKYIVGIDEVGRGPLAGPVSVGIVAVSAEFDVSRAFPGLTDSKKMTEKSRVRVASAVRLFPDIRFGVYSVSAPHIDRHGIERCIRSAIARGLKALVPESADVHVFLDGRLRAPSAYEQETVIHGDARIPVISLASVIAKVARDTYMKHTVHPQFPDYGFDSHKGYGTKMHIDAIRKFGVSPLHRRSYLSGLLYTV